MREILWRMRGLRSRKEERKQRQWEMQASTHLKLKQKQVDSCPNHWEKTEHVGKGKTITSPQFESLFYLALTPYKC